MMMMMMMMMIHDDDDDDNADHEDHDDDAAAADDDCGECLARMMRQEVQQAERVRKQKDSETKKRVRKDYDIGWCVQQGEQI